MSIRRGIEFGMGMSGRMGIEIWRGEFRRVPHFVPGLLDYGSSSLEPFSTGGGVWHHNKSCRFRKFRFENCLFIPLFSFLCKHISYGVGGGGIN